MGEAGLYPQGSISIQLHSHISKLQTTVDKYIPQLRHRHYVWMLIGGEADNSRSIKVVCSRGSWELLLLPPPWVFVLVEPQIWVGLPAGSQSMCWPVRLMAPFRALSHKTDSEEWDSFHCLVFSWPQESRATFYICDDSFYFIILKCDWVELLHQIIYSGRITGSKT